MQCAVKCVAGNVMHLWLSSAVAGHEFLSRHKFWLLLLMYSHTARNMLVMKRWQPTAVFLNEVSMFQGKLVASAWDLSNQAKGGHSLPCISVSKDMSLHDTFGTFIHLDLLE